MADEPFYSVFTPFLRRFTDEKARDIRETAELYHLVGERHRLAALDRVKFGGEIYAEWWDSIPPLMEKTVSRTIDGILRLETTIFEFPEDVCLSQLSLKEQVDLTRFLYAKSHYLNNREKVLELLGNGLGRIVEGLGRAAPSLEGPSAFTIPFVHAIDDARGWIEGIYTLFGESRYQENGVFVALFTQLHQNLCEASGITDPHNPTKKPWKLPTGSKEPISDIVETYLKGTPFLELFNHPVPLKLTHEDRFSHVHILGGSGAGKTQLLQHLILHDLKSEDRPALVIVDSQSDLINKLSHLEIFDPTCGELRDKLILITPRDIKHPPALNIFDVNRTRLDEYDEMTREQVTAGVIQTFDYVFNSLLGADLTAKQGVFFKFVARLMLALPETMGRSATILDLIHLMEDATPYQAAIDGLPDIQRNFFERDFKGKSFGPTKEQIRYRLHAVIENPTLARLFTSPATKIDLFTALNEQSVILVDTAKDFLKGASGHFGSIFISLVMQAIFERAAIPEDERKPAFLIVDEAANYFDSNIDDLLTEARKYKLGCIFAHQFLDQAKSGLKASLAANTAIKLAAGVSTNDARNMAPDMRTTPEFILNQPKLSFAAYIRGVTANAISLPVPVGELEAEPKLGALEYEELREANREKVSLPPQLAEEPADTSQPVQPVPAKSPEGTGTESSKEW